jgi:hypothetical protein
VSFLFRGAVLFYWVRNKEGGFDASVQGVQETGRGRRVCGDYQSSSNHHKREAGGIHPLASRSRSEGLLRSRCSVRPEFFAALLGVRRIAPSHRYRLAGNATTVSRPALSRDGSVWWRSVPGRQRRESSLGLASRCDCRTHVRALHPQLSRRRYEESDLTLPPKTRPF